MMPIIGIDACINDKGNLEPWRIVLFHENMEKRFQTYLMSLSPDRIYIPDAFDEYYGDLTRIEGKIEERMELLARSIHDLGYERVYADSAHANGFVAKYLNKYGIRINPVKTELPEDLVYEDRYGIKGMAGHEISQLASVIGG